MRLSPRIARVGRECVACGCCALACPRDAIHVVSGIIARVEEEQCVGCGKCAGVCPAAVISIVSREEAG